MTDHEFLELFSKEGLARIESRLERINRDQTKQGDALHILTLWKTQTDSVVTLPSKTK